MTPAVRLAALLWRERRLGGAVVPAGEGEAVAAAWPGAVRRLPAHVEVERLTGGLDLAATLATGRPVMAAGLLEGADGVLFRLASPSRMTAGAIGAIVEAIDRSGGFAVLVERADDEPVPAALAERLALGWSDEAPEAGATVTVEDLHTILVAAAARFGIVGMRAPIHAARAALALADGPVREGDVAEAAAWVLAHRATRLPEAEPEPDLPPPDDQKAGEGGRMEDRVVEAVRAALPADLLAALAAGRTREAKSQGRGARARSPVSGRPSGARAGVPRGGARLALVDTLRAAAPWQRLRGRDGARVQVRRDDLRVRRHVARTGATTIFAVDASGSAAAARLAEAKGAVELMLARAHVARAEVALVAFRGDGAEALLPPTRSLTRARRLLADLPGGGGTPVAAGLDAARALALAARARGRTPLIVVLSDGRANVGPPGRSAAEAADAAARAVAAEGLAGVFVDISARPRTEGARIAAAMKARYLALPRGDAAAVVRAAGEAA